MRIPPVVGLVALLLACSGDDTTDTDTDTTDTDTDTDTTDTDTGTPPSETGDTGRTTPGVLEPGDLVWATTGIGTGLFSGEWVEAVTTLDDGTVVALVRHDSDFEFGGASFTAPGTGVHVLAVGLDPDDGTVVWSTSLGSAGNAGGSIMSVASAGDHAAIAVSVGAGHDLLGAALPTGEGWLVATVDGSGTAALVQSIACTDLPCTQPVQAPLHS